jgi:hypothetical protein
MHVRKAISSWLAGGSEMIALIASLQSQGEHALRLAVAADLAERSAHAPESGRQRMGALLDRQPDRARFAHPRQERKREDGPPDGDRKKREAHAHCRVGLDQEEINRQKQSAAEIAHRIAARRDAVDVVGRETSSRSNRRRRSPAHPRNRNEEESWTYSPALWWPEGREANATAAKP